MKKSIFITILSFFVSFNSFSKEVEKPLIEEFHFSPKIAAGLGTTLMANSNKAYLNAKLFLFNYGEDYAGMRFFGVGAVANTDNVSLGFSPMAIHGNQIALSVDIQQNDATGVGISLNYTF